MIADFLSVRNPARPKGFAMVALSTTQWVSGF
jgi:hypothetical protein